ncbi:MAG TPA: histidine kinase [Gaiellaceae bacterium]|jgi:signal transduction histidine kinase|nr:histidine kinase [Gaiellaceae bacterium]
MKRDLPITLVALAAGVGAASLVLGSDRELSPAAVSAVLALVVGWAYIGSGLIAWRQRPENRLGAVMVFIGFAWFVTFLADSNESFLFTLGTVLEDLYLLGFVYLVLSFPTGRLRSKLDLGLLTAAVVIATVVEFAWLLFADSRSQICSDCPSNALEITRNDTVADALLQSQRTVGVFLCVFTVGLLVRRWRRASPPERRAGAPVLWAGSAMFAALAISVANDIFDHPLGPGPAWSRSLVFASIPIAVLAVLLQRRLARGAVAGLVVELGESATPVDLREALGRALGDPSLELAYWVPAGARYVDSSGHPVELPQPSSGRAATVVERDGETIAALIHDPALAENSELVQSVCAAAALTLENARLQAELRARLAELQASRARLVEATESERRRIERDLHDGTQQRLVSIAMTLGLVESKLAADRPAVEPVLREARDALATALEELRELTQGIRPAILVERGLAAALDDLSRRAALPVKLEVTVTGRLPEQVESAAYFVASEALSNAAKHSHASGVRLVASKEGDAVLLEVTDDGIGGAAPGGGSGLRGLADRVEALGGRLTVSSPPGRGTTLRAQFPCE